MEQRSRGRGVRSFSEPTYKPGLEPGSHRDDSQGRQSYFCMEAKFAMSGSLLEMRFHLLHDCIWVGHRRPREMRSKLNSRRIENSSATSRVGQAAAVPPNSKLQSFPVCQETKESMFSETSKSAQLLSRDPRGIHVGSSGIRPFFFGIHAREGVQHFAFLNITPARSPDRVPPL